MQILFDNTSLVTQPFNIKDFKHEAASPRDISMYTLGRQRGGVIINDEYKPKKITINGSITGADVATMEANIDTLKELFSRSGKNLDISYAGSIRRYTATCSSFDPPRDWYNLTIVPFTAEFLVPSGIGIDPTLSTTTLTALTSATYTDSISIIGTAYPKPVITITFTAASSVSKLAFLCNGDKITLTNAIVANDVVVIDCENMQVTLNGAVKDYEGIFPQFIIGANIYELELTMTSATYNLEISYYKSYI